jgi:hypothetical protein
MRAPHLQGSDFSPKKIIAPKTENIGAVNPTAVFKSNGIRGKAQNHPNSAKVKKTPLIKCKPGRFVFMPVIPLRKIHGKRSKTIKNARIKVMKNGWSSWPSCLPIAPFTLSIRPEIITNAIPIKLFEYLPK